MFSKELLTGLSTIFGWTPSLILVLAAIFSAITGMVSLLHHSWVIGVVLIFIGISGVLGFIALTSVCWGLTLPFFSRFVFLVSGVVSLTIIVVVGFSGLVDWFVLRLSWVTCYLYLSPLLIGMIHVGMHVYAYRKISKKNAFHAK